MYKLLLGLMLVTLFVGCSSKEEQALVKSYHEKSQYHKHLQQTEKAQIFEGDVVLATITATYLYTPNFEKNDTRDEVFIVGVQFDDSDTDRMNFDKNFTFNKEKNITITSDNEYILTLNKKKATKVTRLDNNDERLSDISFVIEWGEYYEVRYPHTGNRFNLVFDNSLHGKAVLSFSKVAKFVYTKKGF